MPTKADPSAVPSPFRLVPGLRISNVWLYEPRGGAAWLIDCGHRAERRALLTGLGRLGVDPGQLRGVILTHRHSDHAGNARFLQEASGAQILAHREDADVLGGRSSRPAMRRGDGTRLAGLLAGIENRWPAAPLEIDRALEGAEDVHGLEVHWVPGHTRGSIFLRHAESGALVTGDTLLTVVPPLVQRPGLCLAYCTFAEDMDASHRGVVDFHDREVPYGALLPGHGPAQAGGIRDAVVRMLEETQGPRRGQAPEGSPEGSSPEGSSPEGS